MSSRVFPAADPDQVVAGTRQVSPTLVGREAELRELATVLAAAPAVAVVAGEAGIGKSRLVHELPGCAELTGRRFVGGACRRIREPFPLGPVIDAVRSLGDVLRGAPLSPVAGALRPLLPELADLLPPYPEPLDDRVADRHRVFRGLIEVLAALGPAVLVLEDLHWADELTADFLSYLLADPPGSLSVVLTYRVEEVAPEVRVLTASLPHAVGRARVELVPLDAARTGELAAAVLGADHVSAEFAEYLCERAAGLPFAIEELLALLRARSTLVPSPRGWARRNIDELDVPARIRDSVLERVARLDPPTRAVVRAAAVLQDPVPPSVLSAVAGAPSDALFAALDSGLLAEPEDTENVVAFRHPLAAQAVYEDLAGPVRRELHAQAAVALDALTPPPLGQLSHHLRQAGQLAEWAVVAERAADQATALGHDAEAARLLQDVFVTAPLDPDPRGRVAAKLAQVAIEVLMGPPVLDLLLPVLDEPLSTPVRGELGFRIVLLFNQLGYDDGQSHRMLAGAAPDLGHRPDLQAWAMACLGAPLAPGVAMAEHLRWLDRALDVLDRVDDAGFEVFLLGKIASFLAAFWHPRWRPVTDRMVALDRAPRTRSELSAYKSLALEIAFLGETATARMLLDAAAPAVARGESRRGGLRYETSVVVLDYFVGGWRGLAARAEAVLAELAGDIRTTFDVEVVAACLALACGAPDQARTRLTAVAALAGTVGPNMMQLTLAALARLAVIEGDVDVAVGYADQLLDTLSDKAIPALAGTALPVVVRALALGGRHTDAALLADRYADAVRELDAPVAPAALCHARGLLAETTGDHTTAAADLLDAADRYAAIPHPYEAAQAREAAARCLFAAGDSADDGAAAGHLRDSIACYQELGARWDEDRAASLGRGHGVAPPARHRGGHRGYGQDLSPREREVAELAAVGHTNKEIAATLFLSAKTVDKHLSAALRKLGLRSRTALAARLGNPPVEIGESSP